MAAAKYILGLVMAVVCASACSGAQPAARTPTAGPTTANARPVTPARTPACLADASTTLALDYSVPDNCVALHAPCRAQCLDGDAGACMVRAYAIEKVEATQSEAELLFERACQLGLALGCTNYAASIWAKGGTPEDLDCTRRMFAKSCAVKEKFACGMVGRMLYESAKTLDDYARARASLEQSCAAVKGFPCRVLAKYLEDGKVGIYEPGRIFELLARACEGGDKNACGSPATANQTFD